MKCEVTNNSVNKGQHPDHGGLKGEDLLKRVLRQGVRYR
jgi:hypothetical protein